MSGYEVVKDRHRCNLPQYRSAQGQIIECSCGKQWKCNGLYWRRVWFKVRKGQR